MSVFDLLKKDHKKVSAMFKEIKSAKDISKKHTIFEQLYIDLTIHAEFEEKNLYPLLKKEDATEDMTFESIEEHKVVKSLLEQLKNYSLDQKEWDAKLTVLQENVDHHVEEEEDDLFPKAKKVLDKEIIADLTHKKEVLEGKVLVKK